MSNIKRLLEAAGLRPDEIAGIGGSTEVELPVKGFTVVRNEHYEIGVDLTKVPRNEHGIAVMAQFLDEIRGCECCGEVPGIDDLIEELARKFIEHLRGGE